ncbi:hypothetical protein L228DRAFT_241750 [Xylona heveae TC161]|uniref:MACPF-like domain-containing protein n=1 Tax=Xylona heveae (strain CBS 132557 / TC161) TaxID=1328760 RepID=A0A164ZUE9_XYLHT|nr:hypothetical protein L228DRAFT_241750 [Xylona heveae TC161]KZF19536.1 hypothetical protein L228DRAFT_241750 [Xylona heveae TC161]
MAHPKFHIALDGPADSNFSSFPSTDLENGDPSKIKLQMIRVKSGVSPKLHFSTDGKNRISDDTTLEYYISLTESNSSKFSKPATPTNGTGNSGAAGNGATAGTSSGSNTENTGNAGNSGNAAPPTTTVPTIIIRVISNAEKDKPSLVAQPTLQKALKDFLNEHDDKNGVKLGKMLSIPPEMRQLAGLQGNWAATAGKAGLKEPGDLTEQEWDRVLTNNRALHGYTYNAKLGTLVRAPRRAFEIRPEIQTSGDKKAILPGIPPFYVHDDAQVTVTEVQTAFQSTMANEGFSSTAVEANLGAAPFGSAASASVAWDTENSYAKQKAQSRRVDSLDVAYKFPRVVVELDPDCLQLTAQCRKDAMNVSDEAGRDKFYKKYGNVFISTFTLGGYLHSTRHLTEEEKSSLDQTKEKTRVAAGFSFSTPKASGGASFSKVDSKTDTEGQNSMNQALRLTWEARGGDTLLCSNPPAWANTVKDFNSWRLMEQRQAVSMRFLIRDVDTIAYENLVKPSKQNNQGRDPFKDEKFLDDIRDMLLEALSNPETNALARRMQDFYEGDKFNLEAYHAFLKEIDDEELAIKKDIKWTALATEQQQGVGLWMVKLGIIKV